MGKYTASMEEKLININSWDENYTEELMEIMQSFRSFDAALDEFLIDHNILTEGLKMQEKTAVIREQFKRAGVPVPRSLPDWYTGHKRPERKSMFLLCFALGLEKKETEDFLRRVCLQRGFDCHSPEEAVYYYAFKNGLSYLETKEILNQLKPAGKEKIHFSRAVYVTSAIAEELEQIERKEELVNFFRQNEERFVYNHASASLLIRDLWRKITEENGLAARERKKFGEEKKRRNTGNCRENGKSIWSVYLQILGISGDIAKTLDTDRSLKLILKNNALIHELASDCFPDRDGLNKILNGERVSDERVRKQLIMLVFYSFWVSAALKNNKYEAGQKDGQRCISQLDHYLEDAGFPTLYAGNPFDWLILFMANDDWPLLTFRDYMQELYYERFTVQ